jgi:pilus assembly protein CpaB
VVRNWRVLTAIAAVVLAAIAGVLVWQYVNDADNRAEGKLKQIDVLVAQRTIQRGTSGKVALDQGLIKAEKRVKKDVAANALRPGDTTRIESLFASGTIARGREVFAEDFIASGQIENTALQVAKGKEAISISVDETHGVAKFIAPGDSINILASVQMKNFEQPPGSNTVKPSDAKLTAFMLPGMKVLAVGQTTTFGTQTAQRTDTNGDGKIDDNDAKPQQQAQQTGLLTLAVTRRQAAQIAQAQFVGATFYLTLNPQDFNLEKDFVRPDEIVETLNLFDQPLTKLDAVLDSLKQAQSQAGQGN